jgi:V/A-type H+-transporting ATPase subunit I
MGVLFGGYFGDLPLAIWRWYSDDVPKSLAIIADPVLDSLLFMIIGIAVGAVHLIVGMIIKFNIVRKQESWLTAILDVGSWWVLFAGIGLVFVLPSVGLWVLIAGAVGIFMGGAVAEKNWMKKPFTGLLRFYDVINYASDLLYYSRILALGLTSAVIAQVVNILGTMMGPSIPGFIVLVIAFVLGHALNIGLNVMGTFVHSARLQYVEFFGKFFEDGGRAFDPVKPTSKYTK